MTGGGRLRTLAWCGVVGPAVIALAGLVAGLAQDNADIRRDGLSQVGAATADKACLWNVPLSIGGVLIVVGAAAMFVGLDRGVRPRIAAVLIGVFGAGLALEGALFDLTAESRTPVAKSGRATRGGITRMKPRL